MDTLSRVYGRRGTVRLDYTPLLVSYVGEALLLHAKVCNKPEVRQLRRDMLLDIYDENFVLSGLSQPLLEYVLYSREKYM